MKLSKIEKEKALKLFRKKYKNGGFWYDEQLGKFFVYFTEEGKCYKYNCSNTLQLLKKLKIVDGNVVYKKDYKLLLDEIKRVKEHLQEFKTLPDTSFWFTFTSRPDLIKEYKQRLAKLENDLKNVVVLDV